MKYAASVAQQGHLGHVDNRLSGAPAPAFSFIFFLFFFFSLSLGAPSALGPLDIVHPCHPLATPLCSMLTTEWLYTTVYINACLITTFIKEMVYSLVCTYTANFFSTTWLYCRVAVNVTLTSRCWKPFWTYQYGHRNNVTTPAPYYTGLTLQRHCMGNAVAV